MTERELSELHRLAFEYRNARHTTDAVAAYTELERYVSQDRAELRGLLRGALTAMEVLADITQSGPHRGALPGLASLIEQTRKMLEIAP